MVARRAGENFYVGAGTNGEARTLSLPLDFLEKGVTYTATIYADNCDSAVAQDLSIDSRDVTAADTLDIRMLPAGGQAISFMPKK